MYMKLSRRKLSRIRKMRVQSRKQRRYKKHKGGRRKQKRRRSFRRNTLDLQRKTLKRRRKRKRKQRGGAETSPPASALPPNLTARMQQLKSPNLPAVKRARARAAAKKKQRRSAVKIQTAIRKRAAAKKKQRSSHHSGKGAGELDSGAESDGGESVSSATLGPEMADLLSQSGIQGSSPPQLLASEHVAGLNRSIDKFVQILEEQIPTNSESLIATLAYNAYHNTFFKNVLVQVEKGLLKLNVVPGKLWDREAVSPDTLDPAARRLGWTPAFAAKWNMPYEDVLVKTPHGARAAAVDSPMKLAIINAVQKYYMAMSILNKISHTSNADENTKTKNIEKVEAALEWLVSIQVDIERLTRLAVVVKPNADGGAGGAHPAFRKAVQSWCGARAANCNACMKSLNKELEGGKLAGLPRAQKKFAECVLPSDTNLGHDPSFSMSASGSSSTGAVVRRDTLVPNPKEVKKINKIMNLTTEWIIMKKNINSPSLKKI